jgi:hypothetical protein
MTKLIAHAAWILVAAFVLSFLYELYRATLKAGISRYDSIRVFALQGIPFYLLAALVIALLFAGVRWAASIGLAFCIAMIVVSIVYYNPRIMLERKPGLIDWFEDLVYTGLLFAAATLLLYAVAGMSLA